MPSIHIASSKGDLIRVKELIDDACKKGTVLDLCNSTFGGTSLTLASAHGHLDIVELLLTNGACIYGLRPDMSTALHVAAINGHRDVVVCLINSGAYINAITKDFDTPLHYAASKDRFEVIKVLLANGANKNVMNNYGNTASMLTIKREIKDYIDGYHLEDIKEPEFP